MDNYVTDNTFDHLVLQLDLMSCVGFYNIGYLAKPIEKLCASTCGQVKRLYSGAIHIPVKLCKTQTAHLWCSAAYMD